MIVLIPLMALIITQLLKVAIDAYQSPTHKITAAHLNSYGGMPSAHSALFASLATTSYLMYGWDSFPFAVSFILYLTQVRDAVGIRWHLGSHGAILKQLILDHQQDGDTIVHENIVTRLGHTPLQATCGTILGIAITLLAWLIVT